MNVKRMINIHHPFRGGRSSVASNFKVKIQSLYRIRYLIELKDFGTELESKIFRKILRDSSRDTPHLETRRVSFELER